MLDFFGLHYVQMLLLSGGSEGDDVGDTMINWSRHCHFLLRLFNLLFIVKSVFVHKVGAGRQVLRLPALCYSALKFINFNKCLACKLSLNYMHLFIIMVS